MTECCVPGVHWKVWGELRAAPSTKITRPGGLVVMVIPCAEAEKLAVTERGADIVTKAGLLEPEIAPDQEENCWPEEGEAVNCTVVPLL